MDFGGSADGSLRYRLLKLGQLRELIANDLVQRAPHIQAESDADRRGADAIMGWLKEVCWVPLLTWTRLLDDDERQDPEIRAGVDELHNLFGHLWRSAQSILNGEASQLPLRRPVMDAHDDETVIRSTEVFAVWVIGDLEPVGPGEFRNRFGELARFVVDFAREVRTKGLPDNSLRKKG